MLNFVLRSLQKVIVCVCVCIVVQYWSLPTETHTYSAKRRPFTKMNYFGVFPPSGLEKWTCGYPLKQLEWLSFLKSSPLYHGEITNSFQKTCDLSGQNQKPTGGDCECHYPVKMFIFNAVLSTLYGVHCWFLLHRFGSMWVCGPFKKCCSFQIAVDLIIHQKFDGSFPHTSQLFSVSAYYFLYCFPHTYYTWEGEKWGARLLWQYTNASQEYIDLETTGMCYCE